jgi:hypothetical protein
MPPARVDSSLKLSISAKNLHMASQFKLAYQNTKNEPPPLSFPKLGKMPIRVAALGFDQGWAKLVWNLTFSKRTALVFLNLTFSNHIALNFRKN